MQSLDSRDPRIACGGDDAYAMPTAVCIRSAIDALSGDRRLGVYILDSGISARNRKRIEASLPTDRVALEWLRTDDGVLGGLPASGHVSTAAYSRLLLPRLLPDLDRILYLDSDIVVCGDLGVLWDFELAGTLALAVQDVAAPYIDCEKALPNFERCEPFLPAHRPIENWQDLGLDPLAPYFNSGVMLMDLQGWRTESIGDSCLSVLKEHRSFVKFWDQYALNVVLSGRWGMLPERWNSTSHLMSIPHSSQSAFSAASFEESRLRPEIIHYTGPAKPWSASLKGHLPRAEYFHRARRKTCWRGLLWLSVYLRARADHLLKKFRTAPKKDTRVIKHRTQLNRARPTAPHPVQRLG